MNLAFIGHQLCQEHKPGGHHPECPERLYAIADRMIASGMEMLVTHYDAPEVTREQLLRVHDPDYVDLIFNSAPQDRWPVGLDRRRYRHERRHPSPPPCALQAPPSWPWNW
jgi:acetoin utilization deacetylase AcuC-like enzyme